MFVWYKMRKEHTILLSWVAGCYAVSSVALELECRDSEKAANTHKHWAFSSSPTLVFLRSWNGHVGLSMNYYENWGAKLQQIFEILFKVKVILCLLASVGISPPHSASLLWLTKHLMLRQKWGTYFFFRLGLS